MKAGAVFDNILICDDPEYAKDVVQEVFTNREVCLGFCMAAYTNYGVANGIHHHYHVPLWVILANSQLLWRGIMFESMLKSIIWKIQMTRNATTEIVYGAKRLRFVSFVLFRFCIC